MIQGTYNTKTQGPNTQVSKTVLYIQVPGTSSQRETPWFMLPFWFFKCLYCLLKLLDQFKTHSLMVFLKGITFNIVHILSFFKLCYNFFISVLNDFSLPWHPVVPYFPIPWLFTLPHHSLNDIDFQVIFSKGSWEEYFPNLCTFENFVAFTHEGECGPT